MADKKFKSAEVAIMLQELLKKKQPKSYYQSISKTMGNDLVKFTTNLIKYGNFEMAELRNLQDTMTEKMDTLKEAYKKQIEQEIADRQELLKKLELD